MGKTVQISISPNPGVTQEPVKKALRAVLGTLEGDFPGVANVMNCGLKNHSSQKHFSFRSFLHRSMLPQR